MSAFYLGDLPLASYSNQIAEANFGNTHILEQEGRIYCICFVYAKQQGRASIIITNLRGDEQKIFLSKNMECAYHFPQPICGKSITLHNIHSYHGFYLTSTGGLG